MLWFFDRDHESLRLETRSMPSVLGCSPSNESRKNNIGRAVADP